jgi:hypothetical protein
MLQDLRFGFKLLWKEKAFTITALLTLALKMRLMWKLPTGVGAGGMGKESPEAGSANSSSCDSDKTGTGMDLVSRLFFASEGGSASTSCAPAAPLIAVLPALKAP